MGCWLFHDWELVVKAMATVTHRSLLLRQRWQEDAFVKLYRCRRCGKEKGEMISLDGHKTPLDPMFFEGAEDKSAQERD